MAESYFIEQHIEGEIDIIGSNQIRILLERGGFAFLPKMVIPVTAGRHIKIGARIRVIVRKRGEDTTDEWIVEVLPDRPPGRYLMGRGGGGVGDQGKDEVGSGLGDPSHWRRH